MATRTAAFAGFPRKTLTFLRRLRANNDREWFAAHRADYETCYVEPAKVFITALEPHLMRIAPVVAVPRVDGSIRRINRDTRFSSDKTPYKDYLDISFWEGAPYAGMSSLFVRISPDRFVIGAGFRGGSSARIQALRAAVADEKSGTALALLAKKLRARGYKLRGSHYKRMPRAFDAEGPASEFLLHNALFVVHEQKPAAAQAPGMLEQCVRHWRELEPLHGWLIDSIDS